MRLILGLMGRNFSFGEIRLQRSYLLKEHTAVFVDAAEWQIGATRISFEPADLKSNSEKRAPGMPVEVYSKTGERTVISYLAKPFVDQGMEGFREECGIGRLESRPVLTAC
ncbi:hypothetical protein ACFOHY_11275 [Rhizobium rosettiformans]|uniref:hypothetical protein n=1 Tax=Rhizobium rosettiformans TaxID=1368430 RepID=UPI00361DED05